MHHGGAITPLTLSSDTVFSNISKHLRQCAEPAAVRSHHKQQQFKIMHNRSNLSMTVPVRGRQANYSLRAMQDRTWVWDAAVHAGGLGVSVYPLQHHQLFSELIT